MCEPISTTVAVLALGVSACTAEYARRQARLAHAQAEELRTMKHERDRPLIEISVDQIGADRELVVTNVGTDVVDSVDVQLDAIRNDATPTPRTRAVETQAWNGRSLGRYQAARTSINLIGLDAGQTALVTLRAARGDRLWKWDVDVPVPAL